MIGYLQSSIEVDGVDYPIDTDYRTALLVMELYNDRALSIYERHVTALEIMFTVEDEDGNIVTDVPEDQVKAAEEIIKFLNLGEDSDEDDRSSLNSYPTIDYKDDEQMLFSAVNEVAGREVREESHMHWWTFAGLCSAISNESLVSHVASIRDKLLNGKKGDLSDGEKKFVEENPKFFKKVKSMKAEKALAIYEMAKNGEFAVTNKGSRR